MPSTTITVKFDSESFQDQTASVPPPIRHSWKADFQALVLADIIAGLFGARRHSIQSSDILYTITYQLLLSPFTLHKIASNPFGGRPIDDVFEIPSLYEALCNNAKIWLSFTPTSETASPSFTPSPIISKTTIVDVSTPIHYFIPCSPSLSTCSSNLSHAPSTGETSDISDCGSAERQMEYTSTDDSGSETECEDDEVQNTQFVKLGKAKSDWSDVLDLLEEEIVAFLDAVVLASTLSVIESNHEEEDEDEDEPDFSNPTPALRSRLLFGDSDNEDDEDSHDDAQDDDEEEAEESSISTPAPLVHSEVLDEESASEDSDDDDEEPAKEKDELKDEEAEDDSDDDSDAEEEEESSAVSLGYDESSWGNLQLDAADSDSDDVESDDNEEEEEEEDSGPVSLGYDESAWSNLNLGNDDSDSDSDSDSDLEDDEPTPKPIQPTVPVVENPTPWAPVKAENQPRKPKRKLRQALWDFLDAQVDGEFVPPVNTDKPMRFRSNLPQWWSELAEMERW